MGQVLTSVVSASTCVAITASDTVDFASGQCRAVYVGVGGDVVAVVDGVAITFKNAPTGSVLPIQATRINNTNTTATNMVALY